MAENVEYILSLKDLFSSKIKEADGAAKGLHSTIAGIAGLAAAGFGLIGGVAFLKSSAEAFNEADKASAQLNATLASTGGIAGRTKEQLDAQAEALMRVSTFDDDAITGAQSLLLTFTNIRGEILDKTTPAILDLATKMGGDLKGATIQVGKALQDPAHGMLALRKAGISFSESQQEVIKNLQATGDLAGAQTIILAELNKEFGGSAQADANTYAGQLTILKHEFMNVKEEIGGIVMGLVIKLKPALEKGIELFKDTVDWIGKNKEMFEALGVTIGIVGGAWLIYQVPLIATAVATSVMTAAQWALNVALDANPIDIVIVALAALAGGIYYAWQKSETFRGAVMGVWEVLKGLFNFVVSAGSGIGTYLEGIFTLDTEKIKSGAMEVAKAWKDMDLEADYNKGFTIGAKTMGKDTEEKKGVAKSPTGKASAYPTDASTKKTKASAGSVTGPKSYNINISIGNLVKDFTVSTTNVTEGANKVKELVTQALLSAVNDSQIIAER